MRLCIHDADYIMRGLVDHVVAVYHDVVVLTELFKLLFCGGKTLLYHVLRNSIASAAKPCLKRFKIGRVATGIIYIATQ